jgi:hypothetical protein
LFSDVTCVLVFRLSQPSALLAVLFNDCLSLTGFESNSDSTVSDRGTSTTGGHSREKKLNSRGIVEPAQSHQYTVSLLVVDCGLFLAYLVSAKALIRWTGLCCIAAIH